MDYQPEDPRRTFFGVNNKQLFFRYTSLLAALPTLIGFYFDSSIKYFLFFLSIILFLVEIVFYFRNRSKIIADYKAVNYKGIPLRPLESIDFPIKDSIIMLIIIFVGLMALLYASTHLDQTLDFFSKLRSFFK